MLIVRHSEIFTKSEQVRKYFIEKLVRNISVATGTKVRNRRMRIFLDNDDSNIIEKVSRVFGVASISKADILTLDIEKIKKEALKKTKDWEGSFAVRTQRLSKNFEMKAQDVNEVVGAAIKDTYDLEVNLDNPDNTLHIEIFENNAYLYTEIIHAIGGLPLGTSDHFLLEKDDDNSLLAAWFMMRRGAIPIIKGDKKFLSLWDSGININDKEEKALLLVRSDFPGDKSDLPVFYPLIALDDKEKTILIKEIREGRIPPSIDKII